MADLPTHESRFKGFLIESSFIKSIGSLCDDTGYMTRARAGFDDGHLLNFCFHDFIR